MVFSGDLGLIAIRFMEKIEKFSMNLGAINHRQNHVITITNFAIIHNSRFLNVIPFLSAISE